MLKFIIKNKNYFNIITYFYIIFVLGVVSFTDLISSNNTLLFLALFYTHYFILYFINDRILSKMGMNFGLYSVNERGFKENSYTLFGVIPLIGLLIMSNRINQLLVELEQKVKSGEVKL